MDASEEIEKELRRSHAVLVRHGKHPVYKLPNGLTFVMAGTSVNKVGAKKELVRLKRCLNGIPFKKGPHHLDNPVDEVISHTLRQVFQLGQFLPKELLQGVRKFINNEQPLLIQLPEPEVTRFYDEINIQWELESNADKIALVKITVSELNAIVYASGILHSGGFQETCKNCSLSERIKWLISTQQKE